jgi:hypothetical protein
MRQDTFFNLSCFSHREPTLETFTAFGGITVVENISKKPIAFVV